MTKYSHYDQQWWRASDLLKTLGSWHKHPSPKLFYLIGNVKVKPAKPKFQLTMKETKPLLVRNYRPHWQKWPVPFIITHPGCDQGEKGSTGPSSSHCRNDRINRNSYFQAGWSGFGKNSPCIFCNPLSKTGESLRGSDCVSSLMLLVQPIPTPLPRRN